MDAELKASLQAIREQLEELKARQTEADREYRTWARMVGLGTGRVRQ